MSLPNRTKNTIWALIAFLILIGLLIILVKLGYIPEWGEIIFWGCITLIAFSILGVLLGLLDDIIGQRINKKRLKRYMVIFLPPVVISFFAAGFSAAVHEAEYYPWDTFLLYVIMCLVFWYAGA
ncbi:MAG: hypothetical protein ACM3SR_13870, partial [Ignavibacteriales bacterium]